MKRQRIRVWIVEMKLGRNYVPCPEAKLSLDAAQVALNRWRKNYPTDTFRVRKYVPEVKP